MKAVGVLEQQKSKASGRVVDFIPGFIVLAAVPLYSGTPCRVFEEV
jgi:hypothetical protein